MSVWERRFWRADDHPVNRRRPGRPIDPAAPRARATRWRLPAGRVWLIRKSTVSGQAAAPGAAERSRVQAGWMGAGSGSRYEGDPVAQGLQLADVVAFGALGVDVGVVKAGAQVVVAQVGVGQQVPDDDQDRAAHRHDRLLGATAAGDAPVALPQ